MWPEIKTRKCFSRLAGGADADGRPATALAQRPGKGVPASIVVRVPASFDEGASPFAFGGALWSAVVPRSAGILPALLIFAFAVGFPRTPACPEQSQRVSRLAPPTHRRAFCTAGILAGSLAFSELVTHHSPARQPCGGSLAICILIANPGLEFGLTTLEFKYLKISNREYIAVFQSAFSHPASISTLLSSSIVPLISCFLIYGSAIRIPRNSLKT